MKRITSSLHPRKGPGAEPAPRKIPPIPPLPHLQGCRPGLGIGRRFISDAAVAPGPSATAREFTPSLRPVRRIATPASLMATRSGGRVRPAPAIVNTPEPHAGLRRQCRVVLANRASARLFFSSSRGPFTLVTFGVDGQASELATSGSPDGTLATSC